MKKLKVEIEALETATRSLTVKMSAVEEVREGERDADLVRLTKIEAFAKQKCVILQKDALVAKVFRLFEE